MALITGREVKKGPKQIPYNQKLWNMLVTQAKSRFNKYPSPAAAHWVHSRYLQMGGKFVTSEYDVPDNMRDYVAEEQKAKIAAQKKKVTKPVGQNLIRGEHFK
jgi:hypothetical protein